MNTCQTKLEIRHLSKSFGTKKVLKHLDLVVQQGEIVSLLGASGGGKTTLFHCIAGLLQAEEGEILLDGQPLQPGQVGYMLQKDLLMPHKTLVENLALPLLLAKVPKKSAFLQVKEHLPAFGLENYGNFYPSALSGGMRQRAALLRTYLTSQELLLLDEPFSALDNLTKGDMQQWYLQMMQKIQATTLLITHDIDEALTLSHRIYLLGGQPGQIVGQWSLPQDKGQDFPLTQVFLDYKKEILQRATLKKT